MSVTTGTFSQYLGSNFEGAPCRLCMKKNDKYYSIFNSNISSTMTVEGAIHELLGLRVSVEDGLPNTLCPLCLKKLMEFNDFKKICLESDAELRKISSRNYFKNIQGERTADDELGSSAETKDCIPDTTIGTSQLASSVQVTEIYIPMPDSQGSRANILDNGDHLGEGDYPVLYTPDPAEISSDLSDPLALHDLFHKKEENEDHFGEESYPVQHTTDTAGISSGVSDALETGDLPQASTLSHGEEVDAEGTGAFVIDLDCLLVMAKKEPSPKENDAIEPTVMENGEPILNGTIANESLTEVAELPATDGVSLKTTSSCYLLAERNVRINQRAVCIAPAASLSLLQQKTRLSHSEKGREVMNEDIEKCGALLADKVTSCSISDDGQFHLKPRDASEISGDRTTTTIVGETGGCDIPDTVKSFRIAENGNGGPMAVTRESKERSTLVIKNPGKRTRSKDNLYHCFNCGDVFNGKNDLMEHLKTHVGAGNLDVDANLSIGKDLSLTTLVSRKETIGSFQPTSSKSLNQQNCERQGVRQKGNGLVKEISGGKREKNNVRQLRRTFIADGKSCTDSPHTERKPYSCSECEKSFSQKSNLVRHIRAHTSDKRYSCHQCEKSFSRKGNLVRHIRTHAADERYSCHQCEKSFSQKGNLVRHIRVHTSDKRYSCHQCEKSFSQKGHLVCHIGTHTADKRYSCHQCEKSYTSKQNLVAHKLKHPGVKPYPCYQCEKSFLQKMDLVCHLRTHTKKGPYSCNECGKSFPIKSRLVCHIRTHTKEKPYSCNECGKSFSQKIYLISHIHRHKEDKPYSCDQCEKSYTSKNNLVAHKRAHAGEKPFQCTICRKSYTASSALTFHMWTHAQEKPYSCNECGKSFSRKCNLARHNLKHTGEKPYSCNECEKSFSRKCHLARHNLKHRGVKPYSCYECEKSFSQKSILVSHMRLHTGVKPYSCHLCNKAFTHNSTLVLHLRTHTNEKPYSCKDCEKSFSRKNYLDRHKFTHTGVKPHSCHQCEKTFFKKSDLAFHLRTHTNEKLYSCKECEKPFFKKRCLVLHMRTHAELKLYPCKQCEKSYNTKQNLDIHMRAHSGEKPYSCNHCEKSFSQKVILVRHLRTHTHERKKI
ncbi:zinc finger protein 271-like [Ischnura elegans]|uniref:zinc finger protein 271-like n=1 Tax=Ischnura elegans TaxID=197161 RepID=UPI001ED8771F|nr:zinc finger protein 271-like [Ischnura elegans]XP_046407551.1 zinc finger protein 271-like [Ischnura elegans]